METYITLLIHFVTRQAVYV